MTNTPTNNTNNEKNGKRRRKRGSRGRKITLKDIGIVGGFGLFVLVILSIVGYFLMALVGIIFPSNTSYVPPTKGITIYVQSNGFHTDFIVPIKNEELNINWLQKIGDSTLLAKYSTYKYVSMGWGDDGFYMESYDNSFPTVPTIFSALFLPTRTLMHVNFYANGIQLDDDTARLVVSPQQYQALVKYIEVSFKKDIDNHFIPKNAKGYGKHDYFFHANKFYHLFRTCNDWTNGGLKDMGIKTASKAPFASSVMYYLK